MAGAAPVVTSLPFLHIALATALLCTTAGAAAARALGADVTLATSAAEALQNADVAVITTPWPEYAQLGRGAAARRIPVIDCWRILSKESQAAFDIIWLGYGERETAKAEL